MFAYQVIPGRLLASENPAGSGDSTASMSSLDKASVGVFICLQEEKEITNNDYRTKIGSVGPSLSFFSPPVTVSFPIPNFGVVAISELDSFTDRLAASILRHEDTVHLVHCKAGQVRAHFSSIFRL